ncbi:MAG TPA: energy-coupling factor transporter transmembrane component T [Aeromicrobium sp.]|nr:energy-coupling factor transporter transmembrane component T [Aeromicrobium sp.]
MTRPQRAIVRANPLAQLSVGLFALMGSFAIRSLPVALLAVGCYAFAVALAVPSWRYPALCLLFSGIAAVTVVYSTWRLGGHEVREALTAGLRIVMLSWPGSVAVGYVDPARLADFLAQSLRLPARGVAAFAAALQRFASFGHAWTQIERARRVRGMGPSVNPLSWFVHAGSMSFAMLVHALRGASQTSIAMEARGFGEARDRTWAEPATWTRLDVAVLTVALFLGIVAPVAAFYCR